MNKDIDWFKKVARQWSRFSPPVRPSRGEIAIWRRRMKLGRRVLILGATPELRDLAHSLNSRVVLADMNPEMIIAMAELMKFKKCINQEIWVKGVWTDLPLANGYFDYIVGDFVINNVPPKMKGAFFEKVLQLLKPNGLFITRHLKKGQNLAIDEVMDDYAARRNPNMSEFEYTMQWVSYNQKLKQIRLKDIRRDIENFIKIKPPGKRKKYQELYDKFLEMWPFDKSWYLASDAEEEKMLKKYFQIIDIKYASDHRLVHLCPIFVLRKKWHGKTYQTQT